MSEVTQSCPTLCDPMGCSLPGSSVHGISFSRESSQPRDRTQVSCIAGRCFTIWAIWKLLAYCMCLANWWGLCSYCSQVALVIKKPPAYGRRHKRLGFNCWVGKVLEEVMVTHSSILACRIPWTEEPGGLQSIELHRVGHDWSDLAHTHAAIDLAIDSQNFRTWRVYRDYLVRATPPPHHWTHPSFCRWEIRS